MGELTSSITSGVGYRETETLVERLKEKDEAAFAEVFTLYKDLIYSLSLNMLADKSEALDVTQDVFVTLFRKVDQFRGECSLKTWLYRVTFNKVANRNRWWRRRRGSRTLSLGLNGHQERGAPSEPASDSPQPDRELLSREIREAVEAGLEELPFEQRAAVTLRDMHGLAYEEIAGILGTRIGTVKSRIARGREKLREVLGLFREGEQA